MATQTSQRLSDRLSEGLFQGRTLWRAGMFKPDRPDRVARSLLALHRFGPSLAAGCMSAAAARPEGVAIIDERGPATFSALDARSNALAHALGAHGIREDSGVAIMCRNHRGFVEASVACSKLGASALYMNTAFAAPQVADVINREAPGAIVYDQEFQEAIEPLGNERLAVVALREEGLPLLHTTLDELTSGAPTSPPRPPASPGRVVILTSGTTGTPKGANRESPGSLGPAASLLSRIPLRARETTVIAAPLFHSWGFAHLILGIALQSTMVLHRRFDPLATLEAVQGHQASALIVVPVMLQRMLELDNETLERIDTSSLRVIASSGSELPGPLAQRTMDALGEVVYNLYGSTEVAWATIATPEDLRAAPGTAGRVPRGTVVKILDEQMDEQPVGETGRIFVGNEMLFEGYTGGGDKQRFGSLMSTGDVGHFDVEGRLFIDGRDDEMIVSGGENVFPAEVEDLLARVPGVREVAVVGVPDDEFGQRLRAYVALAPGTVLGEEQLREHVKANLARYKVPRDIRFLDKLPRNATGKVLKRDLARD